MPNKKYDGPSMDKYGGGPGMHGKSHGPEMDHGDGPGMHHESAKQERKDLMKDNPVVRDMDSSRPWMSKHASQSRMGGSPLRNEDGQKADLLSRGARKVKKVAKKVKKAAKKVAKGAAEGISEFAQDFKERAT
jgi:hypothetical protein